jgi:acyl carrier protein
MQFKFFLYKMRVPTFCWLEIIPLCVKFGVLMASSQEIISLLNEVMSFDPDTNGLNNDSLLLGEIPEFDSMTVVSVLEGIEAIYEIQIADEDITPEAFESVRSLTQFVTDLQEAKATH